MLEFPGRNGVVHCTKKNTSVRPGLETLSELIGQSFTRLSADQLEQKRSSYFEIIVSVVVIVAPAGGRDANQEHFHFPPAPFTRFGRRCPHLFHELIHPQEMGILKSNRSPLPGGALGYKFLTESISPDFARSTPLALALASSFCRPSRQTNMQQVISSG
jgi:hypothetical protein